jgi:hypothetical protein
MPEPPLQDPHCIAILKPWINVGNVGKIVLRRLGKMYAAEEMGRLDRPGKFYDFTRYRPSIRLIDGNRSIRVPNTRVLYAQRAGASDLVFIEMLEPHAFAEDFNDSVIELLKALKVTRYIQLGGMYDSVSHSRQLPVTGSARGWEPPAGFGDVRLGGSRYQGPTSMISQVSDRVWTELNLETLSLMVHLPLYLKLDDDFAGSARLLKILSELYGFSAALPEIEMAEQQYEQVGPAMNDNPALRDMVERFERESDSETDNAGSGEEGPGSSESISLSPEIEQFLSEIEQTDERSDGEESGPRNG